MRLHDTKKNGTVTPVRSSPHPPPPPAVFYWAYLASRQKTCLFRFKAWEQDMTTREQEGWICEGGLFIVESALSLSSYFTGTLLFWTNNSETNNANIECFHSSGQHICKSIGKQRKRLHKKRVQLPGDWFGTPTWPPFHCFGTPCNMATVTSCENTL